MINNNSFDDGYQQACKDIKKIYEEMLGRMENACTRAICRNVLCETYFKLERINKNG